jgi:gliding motility-associated lipoprotein GldH
MKMHKILFGLIIFLIFLFVSCQQNTIYKQVIDVDESSWLESEILKFSFQANDTISRNLLILEVDHSTEYANQNLYIRIHTIQPPADSTVQIVSLDLADLTGKWQGKCRGDHCTAQVMLKEYFKFQFEGEYQIWVEPYMREKSIHGIRKMALILERTES